MDKVNQKYVVGIDPGTKTGIAIWDVSAQSFEIITTCKIHEAMSLIKDVADNIRLVRLEDPTRRGGRRRASQGAGSIKRDYRIWCDYLECLDINVLRVRAGDTMTKVDAKKFAQITGYKKRTSEHARDAAMMVFKFNANHKQIFG